MSISPYEIIADCVWGIVFISGVGIGFYLGDVWRNGVKQLVDRIKK